MKQVIRSLFIVAIVVWQLQSCNTSSTADSTKDTTQSNATMQSAQENCSVMEVEADKFIDLVDNLSKDEKNFVPSTNISLSDLEKLAADAKKKGTEVIRFSIVRDPQAKNGLMINFYNATNKSSKNHSLILDSAKYYMPNIRMYSKIDSPEVAGLQAAPRDTCSCCPRCNFIPITKLNTVTPSHTDSIK